MSRVSKPELKYIIVPEEHNKDKFETIKQIIAESLIEYFKQVKDKNSD